MAVATYTSSVFTAGGVKDVFVGNQAVSGKMVYSGTVGDIVFLAKVPNGAKIVDFYEYHSNGQTAAAVSFGFDRGVAAGGGGNASCLVSSGAVAGTGNRMNLALAPDGQPVTISLSDLDPVRYAILVGKAESGSFTISLSIGFVLSYRKDGPDPV
jgi:hypothetical protein